MESSARTDRNASFTPLVIDVRAKERSASTSESKVVLDCASAETQRHSDRKAITCLCGCKQPPQIRTSNVRRPATGAVLRNVQWMALLSADSLVCSGRIQSDRRSSMDLPNLQAMPYSCRNCSTNRRRNLCSCFESHYMPQQTSPDAC